MNTTEILLNVSAEVVCKLFPTKSKDAMYFGKTGMNVRFLFLQTAIFFLQQHRFFTALCKRRVFRSRHMCKNQNKNYHQLKMFCFSGHAVSGCKLSFYNRRCDFNRHARLICYLKDDLKDIEITTNES